MKTFAVTLAMGTSLLVLEQKFTILVKNNNKYINLKKML